MNGRRALALGVLAGWALAAGFVSFLAVTVQPVTWLYPVGVACSLVIGWGLPALWFGTPRAFPSTPKPPARRGGVARGASGAANGSTRGGT